MMMKPFRWIVPGLQALLAAGCAMPVPPAPQASPLIMQPAVAPAVHAWTATTLPDGVWKGNLDWGVADAEFGSPESPSLTVLAHCAGSVQVWKAEGEDRMLPSNGRGTLVSYGDLHLLSFFSQFGGPEPGWVQATLWTFVEIDAQHLDARLSRSVSNRGVPADDEQRSLGNTAQGRLTKIADRCPDTLEMPPAITPPAWRSQALYGLPDLLPEGLWSGKLAWADTDADFGHDPKPVTTFLTHCEGELEIYRLNASGQVVLGSAPGRIASLTPGTHLVHSAATSGDPDGWVEITLWTLVDSGDDRLTLRLSRSVSNRMVATDDTLRSIHNTAWGQLRRLSKSCNPADLRLPPQNSG